MKQPAARKAYAKRKAWVEPVFSYIGQVMRLGRFRRKGLAKVRLEFSMNATAYNLGRLLADLGPDLAGFYLIWRVWMLTIARRHHSRRCLA